MNSSDIEFWLLPKIYHYILLVIKVLNEIGQEGNEKERESLAHVAHVNKKKKMF